MAVFFKSVRLWRIVHESGALTIGARPQTIDGRVAHVALELAA